MTRSIENLFFSAVTHRGSIQVDELETTPSLVRPLPPLLDALQKFEASDWGPMISRELETMGQTPVEFLLTAKAIAEAQGISVMDITHPPLLRAAENTDSLFSERDQVEAVFGQDVQTHILKTTTVSFGDNEAGFHHFLVSGFGDFKVSKAIQKTLARAVGAHYDQRYINNIQVFDPDIELNMVPGLVKPIVAPEFLHHIDGICYLHLVNPEDVGAITTTLLDSLLTQVSVLEAAIEWYLMEFCTQKVVIEKYPDLNLSQATDIYLIRKPSLGEKAGLHRLVNRKNNRKKLDSNCPYGEHH